jgi:hypothetical protein
MSVQVLHLLSVVFFLNLFFDIQQAKNSGNAAFCHVFDILNRRRTWSDRHPGVAYLGDLKWLNKAAVINLAIAIYDPNLFVASL